MRPVQKARMTGKVGVMLRSSVEQAIPRVRPVVAFTGFEYSTMPAVGEVDMVWAVYSGGLWRFPGLNVCGFLLVELVEVAGGCWRLLEVAGGCWGLLEVAGGCWRLLEVAGGCWRLLEVVGGCWRLLEDAGVAGGCWRLLEVARGCWGLLEVASSFSLSTSGVGVLGGGVCSK
eukprot:690041-Prymnesium_polylepis.1